MDVLGIRARSHVAEGNFLSLKNGVVEVSQRFAGAPAHDSARNIAKIAGFLGTWIDIDDNRFVGAQWAVTFLVRITTLSSAGDNRMGSSSTRLKNRGVDYSPQLFRSQRHIMVKQRAITTDPGRSQYLDGFGHPNFCHNQG